MSMNILNDISAVYLQQVVEKKDDSYLETDMKKRHENNEKAREEMKRTKANKDMVKAARKSMGVEDDDEDDINEATYSAKAARAGKDIGKPGKQFAKIAKSAAERYGSEERGKKVAGAVLAKLRKEETEIEEAVKGADPEMRKAASAERRTGDKLLSKSEGDKNAANMKRKIEFADKISKVKRHMPGYTYGESLDPVGQEDADIDNDGDSDKTDKYLHNRRKAIGKAIAKKKGVKEGFSNWRQDLAEVMDDVEASKEIKEKKVNNKIKINPEMKEAVEDLGCQLIEMVEIDEMDYIIESTYDELLEDGYDEDDIEEAIEYALIEAKVTFGHDTSPEKKRSGLLDVARKKLAGAKKSAKAAVARGARKVAKRALGVARKMEGGDSAPKTAERKPSTYRGAGAGTKERVSSGSYTPPTKKKAEKPSDPWEGSATTPPKAKAKKVKATTKTVKAPARKKKSKLDDLLASVRNEETSVERIDRIAKEKVAQRAAAAKKEKEDRAKSASAFQAHKKEVIAKGGTPVSALDSWQKMKMNKEEVENLDEKALSQQQQKFMGMVYAVKKGEMKAPSAAVAKAAEGMTKKQARDFAKTKHEGLPKKVEEQMDEPMEPAVDKQAELQKKKIQMQKVRDLTTRIQAARKGVY